MAIFDKVESPEDFKHRLDSLTEKINKINKNVDTQSVRGAEGNKRFRVKES